LRPCPGAPLDRKQPLIPPNEPFVPNRRKVLRMWIIISRYDC
jgi:hypothetical protein